MKRLYLFFLLSILTGSLLAQTSPDTIGDLTLDVLKTPTNPAFIIMNTSPAEVVEPGSAPEFFASVQNASDNFSALPNNYGFTITPFWWGEKAKNMSFKEDFSDENPFTFYRTLSVSAGMVKGVAGEDNLWRYGIGMQSTLLRGKIDKKKKEEYLARLGKYQENFYTALNKFFENDPEYKLLDSQLEQINSDIREVDTDTTLSDEEKIALRMALIERSAEVKNEIDSLKRELSEIFVYPSEKTEDLEIKLNEMVQRYGLKWDVGGGISFESLDNKVDEFGLYRAGLWSNFGGDLITNCACSRTLGGFLLVRYLYYNEIFYKREDKVDRIENLHTVDFGGKFQFKFKTTFTFGVEAVYRVGLANSLYDDSYKINGLLQYYFGKNKSVYASFGNSMNEYSSGRPDEFAVVIGINLGFGGNINLYDF
jgi:hypothetical protein